MDELSYSCCENKAIIINRKYSLLNYAYITSLTPICSWRSHLEYFLHGSEFKTQKYFPSKSHVKDETEC